MTTVVDVAAFTAGALTAAAATYLLAHRVFRVI